MRVLFAVVLLLLAQSACALSPNLPPCELDGGSGGDEGCSIEARPPAAQANNPAVHYPARIERLIDSGVSEFSFDVIVDSRSFGSASRDAFLRVLELTLVGSGGNQAVSVDVARLNHTADARLRLRHADASSVSSTSVVLLEPQGLCTRIEGLWRVPAPSAEAGLLVRSTPIHCEKFHAVGPAQQNWFAPAGIPMALKAGYLDYQGNDSMQAGRVWLDVHLHTRRPQ